MHSIKNSIVFMLCTIFAITLGIETKIESSFTISTAKPIVSNNYNVTNSAQYNIYINFYDQSYKTIGSREYISNNGGSIDIPKGAMSFILYNSQGVEIIPSGQDVAHVNITSKTSYTIALTSPTTWVVIPSKKHDPK